MEGRQKINWGIIGPGIIARRMADALQIHPDCRLVAAASKSRERAVQFGREYAGVQAMNYQELVNQKDIDVVYVATTHNYHHENAKLALEHGKHVVIEKPFTVNAREARNLVALARERKLFLMEAIWVRFLPSLQLLKSKLKQGAIGQVKLIDISFGGFVAPHYEKRLITPELAGGVTLDMGIYPISVVCFLLGERPSEINSFSRFSDTGVDEFASYQFRFPSGCIATISTSYNLKMKNEAIFYGSKGYIEFGAFPSGHRFTLHRHGGTNDIKAKEEYAEDHTANGFIFQVKEAVKCIREGKLESGVIPHDETVEIMGVMDTMRADWDFKYPFE